MTDLLKSWDEWHGKSAPFILDEDKAILSSARSTNASVTHTSWPEVYGDVNFGAPGDNRLHLGLVPHPFCGDLKNAEVYILMLNPGYGPWDYFGEFEVPDYRKATLSNLKQQFTSDTLPFFMLDPKFAWHGAFRWWHGKFAKVIEQLAEIKGISYSQARYDLGHKISSIELMPYHSTSFHDSDHWVRDLPSVNLAKEFVKEYVIPKVRSGKAIAIVTRRADIWDLPEHSGVIRYSKSEARAAHLSPNSSGGRAIIDHIR